METALGPPEGKAHIASGNTVSQALRIDRLLQTRGGAYVRPAFWQSIFLTVKPYDRSCFIAIAPTSQPRTQPPQPKYLSALTKAFSFLEGGDFCISMAPKKHLSTQSWQPSQFCWSTSARTWAFSRLRSTVPNFSPASKMPQQLHTSFKRGEAKKGRVCTRSVSD